MTLVDLVLLGPDSPPNAPGALCAQTDPEAFFPPRGGDPGPAKQTCLACDHLLACREWVLDQPHSVPGVWAATTETERRELRQKRGILDA
jgi:WhiB family redox-sensing transcriptional regulator